MPRVVDGTRRKGRRKKLLEQTKGYRGTRRVLFRAAKDAVAKAGQYAYRDRRNRKRDFRSLWIARISAACRLNGCSYSIFMQKLSLSNISLNRKVLSNLAVEDPEAFGSLVRQVVPTTAH